MIDPTTAVYSVNSSRAGSCLRIEPSFIPFARKARARSRRGSSAAANRSVTSGPSRPASRRNCANSGHSSASRNSAWMTASALRSLEVSASRAADSSAATRTLASATHADSSASLVGK